MRDGGFHLKVAFDKREEKLRKGKRGEEFYEVTIVRRTRATTFRGSMTKVLRTRVFDEGLTT
jgi:hypothetical protein